jgi:hypothetical protein
MHSFDEHASLVRNAVPLYASCQTTANTLNILPAHLKAAPTAFINGKKQPGFQIFLIAWPEKFHLTFIAVNRFVRGRESGGRRAGFI